MTPSADPSTSEHPPLHDAPAPTTGATPLPELALLFLKLGTIAFGGPAAHIAMMEDEVVRRRRWLTREQFLDYLGATNLIPGPNSTELAIHIGHARAGWRGLLIAGASFILPAALIVATVAWAYMKFGTLPQGEAILHGVKPVVIAVVLQAIWRLGRSAVKSPMLAAVAAAATVAAALGVNELVILAGAGGAMALARSSSTWGAAGNARGVVAAPVVASAAGWSGPGGAGAGATSATPVALAAATGVAVGGSFTLPALFAVFAKIGAVLFGSGYVLLAFMRADLVERLHWLSERQLLDAVAVGQVTPGPVFTTATFVGYVLGGVRGAVVATVGIFLPAFVFVALSGPLVPRLRRSPAAGAVLDGVNAGSLALMAVVTWQLAHTALADRLSVSLAVLSVLLLLWRRVNSAWLVIGGALAGVVASL
ncbi:MAG: chromate transporter [Gemmatimonadetes bacterium SCN 70-22]|nr:MAG: chromate transporter [Gemmatimonadetes bacterium SCN 70-22]